MAGAVEHGNNLSGLKEVDCGPCSKASFYCICSRGLLNNKVVSLLLTKRSAASRNHLVQGLRFDDLILNDVDDGILAEADIDSMTELAW